MRDNKYLLFCLKEIIAQYFYDLNLCHNLEIKFSRANRRVMGSVRYLKRQKTSLIRVNGYLRNSALPGFLINAIIAHELCHLVHGFSSYQKPKYRYPHHGGIIKRELKNRGLLELDRKLKKWLKTNWRNII